MILQERQPEHHEHLDGPCQKAFTWKHKEVCWYSCETWFHIDCQGISKHMYSIMKMIYVNFQSIPSKKLNLLEMIDIVRPDIILSTEPWLDKNLSSYDYFPSDLCNVHRNDRPPNKNDQSHGGILIAIIKDL